jgi:hypothetical protein
MTLMPVSNISTFGSSSSNGGGSRWIGHFDVLRVERPADHVPDVSQGLVSDGHGDRVTRIDHDGSPPQAVGRLHADRAHRGIADVLGHLRDDRFGPVGAFTFDMQRGRDLGKVLGREFDVDHGADNLYDPALRFGLCDSLFRHRH